MGTGTSRPIKLLIPFNGISRNRPAIETWRVKHGRSIDFPGPAMSETRAIIVPNCTRKENLPSSAKKAFGAVKLQL